MGTGKRVTLLLLIGAPALAALLYLLLDRGVVRFNYPGRSEYPVRGIDVSHHQGGIDWARVARTGVHFAYHIGLVVKCPSTYSE